MDAPLAEALAADSGSEADDDDDEELTTEQLRELLEAEEDEIVEEELSRDFEWSEDFSSFHGNRETFSEESGPKIDGTSPSGLFSQLWDHTLMENIVTETNRYAWENISPHFENSDAMPTASRMRRWVDTTVSEMYRLVSVIILMGMCCRGRVDEYWTTGILGMPGFRCLMSLDRFTLLMRFLHFADNNMIHAQGAERKLAKIAPILEHLNKKFKSVYTPRREVSIDESLLLWKGRLSWIQCIRSKAARFGIKSYECCICGSYL